MEFSQKPKWRAIRLHLELIPEMMMTETAKMLRRYGESSTGQAITRDILIPPDMTLHNLHYAIQKLFGWRNSHLRRFELTDPDYDRLTGGMVKGWADLVGTLFQPPSEGEADLFWDDEFTGGSFPAWLRRKYTGPYRFGGQYEQAEVARADVQALLDHFPNISVREAFADYYERTKDEKAGAPIRILRQAPLADLTLEELQSSLILDGGTRSLLERLVIGHLLQGSTPAPDEELPAVQKLVYYYDFGDNWIIHITRVDGYEDLLEGNYLDQEELNRAEYLVGRWCRPVCIRRDGMNVMDDVGGLHGFADFLFTIYEGVPKSEGRDMRAWAKGQGWKETKESIWEIL